MKTSQLYSSSPKSIFFHGVFLEVFGVGLLLTGKSGVGKSETALALIDRGSRLVADDSVIFDLADCPDQTLIGRCPAPLKNLLEVRGLGIVNVAELFGPASVKDQVTLRLVIHLLSREEVPEEIFIKPAYSSLSILEISIPQISLSIASQHNPALLIETAVRHYQSLQDQEIQQSKVCNLS